MKTNLHFTMATCLAFLVFACSLFAQSETKPTTNVAASPEFKIVTSVMGAGTGQPVSHNQTIFMSHLVCDVRFDPASPDSPIEFTLYEPNNHKFILLDVRRKLRLEMDTFQLLRIVDSMRKELEADPRTEHLARQQFEEKFEPNQQLVTVENEYVSYSAAGQRPSNDTLLPRYHDFLDQFTRLSSTSPSSYPPFARIRLNQAIKKYGFVPTTISRTIKASSTNSKIATASTQHQLVESLSEQDRAMVLEAKKYWTQFTHVDLSKYREIAELKTAASKPKR